MLKADNVIRTIIEILKDTIVLNNSVTHKQKDSRFKVSYPRSNTFVISLKHNFRLHIPRIGIEMPPKG